MKKSKFVGLVVAGLTSGVLVAGVMTGCSPQVATLESYLGQEVSWTECDESLLLPSDWRASVFSDALSSAQVSCATVVVPASYESTGSSEEFALQLMRVGSATAPMGDIFINPGGPGGSGIEQVQTSEFPAALLEQYAFIGFDPRGVNFSTFTSGREIRCDDHKDLETYFTGEASPSSDAEYEENLKLGNAFMEECISANPQWWTLSTENVVQDLEVLRTVVTGEEPLNFIGSSYGTTIAGMYVTRFPEHVGKIVLDSPTTVDDDPIASSLADMAANEEKLRIYLEAYAGHAGISFDDALARLLEFRQLADDDELIGYAGITPYPGEEGQYSSETLFVSGIFALNYMPEAEAIETFNLAMDDIENYYWNGTFEALALSMDGYDIDSLEGPSLEEKNLIRSNEYEILTIVNTMDFSLPPLSEEEEAALEAQVREIAPLLTALSEGDSDYEYEGELEAIDWYSVAMEDDSIPDPPTTPMTRTNTSGKQLLIIGSLRESVTPFQFARDTATLLSSPLVTVDSSMHAPAAYYDNACVNDVLVRYFVMDEILADISCPGS